jgi:hypothetical protein
MLAKRQKTVSFSFCFLPFFGNFDRLTAQVGSAPISVVGAFAANAEKMKSSRIRYSEAILNTSAIDNSKGKKYDNP